MRAILADRWFRLVSAGYFGHMWELYAMWAWMAAFYGDLFDSARAASVAAFAVIAAGAAGSFHAGLVSDRVSRTGAAAQALGSSAALALVTGFLVDAPVPIVVGAGLVWGFWVVADSAQFSTIVTEETDAVYVGTALTLQLAIGFTLTVFTIFLVPVVRDAHGLGLGLPPCSPRARCWGRRPYEPWSGRPSPTRWPPPPRRRRRPAPPNPCSSAPSSGPGERWELAQRLPERADEVTRCRPATG
ncbi:MAG: hypothetical protein ACFCVK_01935 [Acidimicrobiales bacterium]